MPLLINGQRIEDSVVDAEFGAIKSFHENQGNVSCCERDPEFRASARQNVVAKVLLAQEAGRRVPPTAGPELDAAVEKLKEEYGGESWFMARTGVTADTMHLVRRDVDLDLRVRRLLEDLGDEGGAPTEADLRAHYEQNLQAFLSPEEVRASHMLRTGRGPIEGAPPTSDGSVSAFEGREAAYDRLRRVRAELLAGGDFDALARLHSERGDEQIDLGFFKRNELAAEFETVAFSMNVGEISPVFVSSYGFHLLKLTDRKPADPRPFDEARSDVEKHFIDQRRQQAVRALVDRLRESADVSDVADEPEPSEPEPATAS